MNKWQTKKVSLAAYAIGKGARLINIEQGAFNLESTMKKSEVKVMYLGSDESRFNMNLIQLQNLKRG